MKSCTSKIDRLHIEVAVDVLKTQDRESLEALKNFLLVLPSPTAIEEVLKAAIYELAEADVEACRWIFRHPGYLMPEVDLIEVALNWAILYLHNQGFEHSKDFHLDSDCWLFVSERAKTELMGVQPVFYRLLLQEILQIRE